MTAFLSRAQKNSPAVLALREARAAEPSHQHRHAGCRCRARDAYTGFELLTGRPLSIGGGLVAAC